jgi:hypothetical protein
MFSLAHTNAALAAAPATMPGVAHPVCPKATWAYASSLVLACVEVAKRGGNIGFEQLDSGREASVG